MLDMAKLAGYYAHVNSFGIAHYVMRAAQAAVEKAAASGHEVDFETRPNIEVAWAQLYLQQLLATRLLMADKPLDLQESVTSVPEELMCGPQGPWRCYALGSPGRGREEDRLFTGEFSSRNQELVTFIW